MTSREDLETRATALHLAARSWGEPDSGDAVDWHADNVTRLASMFADYIAAGTVYVDPTNPQREAVTLSDGEAAPAAPSGPVIDGLFDTVRRVMNTQPILDAAFRWVDEAHTNNAAGPDNWRRWADDKDMRLINAVLRYRGQEPIDQ